MPTKDGGTLHTILDVRTYMLGLSKDRKLRSQWQHAVALLLAQAVGASLRVSRTQSLIAAVSTEDQLGNAPGMSHGAGGFEIDLRYA